MNKIKPPPSSFHTLPTKLLPSPTDQPTMHSPVKISPPLPLGGSRSGNLQKGPVHVLQRTLYSLYICSGEVNK